MTVIDHNIETGEIIERELTNQEISQFKKDELEAQTLAAAKEAKAIEKAALLAKLGITEDEAKLLLG
jgi:demethoxyubiquinone hydroxylase (CLK1/Coq7/Cat5 family)